MPSTSEYRKPRVRVSGLDQLIGCPGSQRYCEALGIRRRSDHESWEGQWCHHRAATLLVEQHGAIAPRGLPPPRIPASFVPSGFAEWKVRYYMDRVLESAGADRAIVVEDEIGWEFDRFILTGHPDATTFTFDASEIGTRDLKSGSNTVDAAEFNWQLAGYAAIRKRQYPQCRRQHICIDQPDAPEDERSVPFTIEGELLEKLPDGLATHVDRALAQPNLLRTGKHCRWCPAFLTCPAVMVEIDLTEELTAQYKQLVDADGRPTTVQLAQLALASKLLTAPLKDAREELKQRLAADGPFVDAQGTSFSVVDTLGPREIASAEGWERLVSVVNGDRAYGCMSLSADKIEKAIAAERTIPVDSEKKECGKSVFRALFGAITSHKPQKELVIK